MNWEVINNIRSGWEFSVLKNKTHKILKDFDGVVNLVTLFNDISTFVGNLMLKSPL